MESLPSQRLASGVSEYVLALSKQRLADEHVRSAPRERGSRAHVGRYVLAVGHLEDSDRPCAETRP
jgi:hypothetical protein